jgi:hypothetical protein
MSTSEPDRKGAIIQQSAWKSAEMVRFQTAIVERAYALALIGISEFGSDDVPEQYQTHEPGLAGNACNVLETAGVIEAIPIAMGGQLKKHRSKRTSAKARWVTTYRLCSIGVAETWLTRHGVPVEGRQMRLAI